MSKFDNVPVEEDTAVAMRFESTLGDYDVLYEKWFWDGFEGESLIFIAADVEHMSDDALKAYVAEFPVVECDISRITLKRNSHGFTFVNFNFGAL